MEKGNSEFRNSESGMEKGNSEFEFRNSEFGNEWKGNSEFGIRNSRNSKLLKRNGQFGVRNSEFGIRNSEWKDVKGCRWGAIQLWGGRPARRFGGKSAGGGA